MSDRYIIKQQTLTDIADAIREKNSLIQSTMTPVEMPDYIKDIKSGGGSGTIAPISIINCADIKSKKQIKNIILTNHSSDLPLPNPEDSTSYLEFITEENNISFIGEPIYKIEDSENGSYIFYTEENIDQVTFVGDSFNLDDYSIIETISPELIYNLTNLSMKNCINYTGSLTVPFLYNFKGIDKYYLDRSKYSIDTLYHGCSKASNIKIDNRFNQKNLQSSLSTGEIASGSSSWYNGEFFTIDKVKTNYPGYMKAVGPAKFYDGEKDLNGAYQYCVNITSAEIPVLVENMHLTFTSCSKLKELSPYSFENLTDISWCFSDCSSLIRSLECDNILDMRNAYVNCSNLTSGFIGSKVISADYCFSNCNNLIDLNINIEDPNASLLYPLGETGGDNITDLYFNFNYYVDSYYGSIPYFNFQSSGVNYFSNLERVYFGNKTTHTHNMFYNCQNLVDKTDTHILYLIDSDLDTKIDDASYMFYQAFKGSFDDVIIEGNLFKEGNDYSYIFDGSGVSHIIKNISAKNMAKAYSFCSSLTSVEGEIRDVVNMADFLSEECPSVRSGNLFINSFMDLSYMHYDYRQEHFAYDCSAAFGYRTTREDERVNYNVIFINGSPLQDSFNRYYGITPDMGTPIESLDMTSFGYSTLATGKYYPSINLSVFTIDYDYNTCKKVDYLFAGNKGIFDSEIKEILTQKYNIENITSMSHTYENTEIWEPYIGPNVINICNICNNVTSLSGFLPSGTTDEGNFNNVVDASNAFNSCQKLKGTIPNMQNVVNLAFAFNGCENITSFSSFGDNITNMNNAFNYCVNLEKSLADLNLLKVKDFNYAFRNCVKIRDVVIPPCSNKMEYSYYGCSAVTDFPEDLTYLNIDSCNATFAECSLLGTTKISEIRLNNCSQTFLNCNNLSGNIKFTSECVIKTSPGWGGGVLIESNSSINNCFAHCYNLDTIVFNLNIDDNVDYLNRATVNMSHPFYRDHSLKDQLKTLNIYITNLNVYKAYTEGELHRWADEGQRCIDLCCTDSEELYSTLTPLSELQSYTIGYANGHRETLIPKRGVYQENTNTYIYCLE